MEEHFEPITKGEILRAFNYGEIRSRKIQGIVLDNISPIRNEIKFNNCSIADLEIINANRIGVIIFENCKISGKLFICNIKNDIKLSFINPKFNEDDAHISLANLSFNNFEIRNYTSNASINIEKCTGHKLEISNSKLQEILINSSSISHTLFENVTTKFNLAIGESFIESISLKKVNSKTILCRASIRPTGQPSAFNFENIKCNDFTIKSSSLDTITFLDTTIDNYLSIQANNIHILNIQSSDSKSRMIGSLVINANSITNFNITGIQFKEIKLSNAKIIQNLIVTNTEITNEFDLTGVRINTIEFNVLNIKKAILKIHRTLLGSKKLINVEWSINNKAYELNNEVKNLNVEDYIFQLHNLKASYRDFKVYYLNEHNYFDAMLFATNELRIEEKIKYLKTWKTSLNSTLYNFGDWLVLASNKWFSNFGLSWIRPLVWWMFLFHLIPLCIIINNTELGISTPFDFSNFTWIGIDSNATAEGLKLYLKLLFPFHDSEQSTIINGQRHIINLWDVGLGIPDFFIRIFAPYFIFLFIRGTRKFNFKVG